MVVPNISYNDVIVTDLTIVDEDEINGPLKVASDMKEYCGLQGLGYIAGYIVHKFFIKYPHLGMKSCDFIDNNICLTNADETPWITLNSRGGLKKPTDTFLNQIQIMEDLFHDFHGEEIYFGTNVLKSFQDMLLNSVPKLRDLPEEVILHFAKTRLYIRLKHLNLKLAQNARIRFEARNAKKLQQVSYTSADKKASIISDVKKSE